jgi:PPK2 family polyphosphate:nucleotide phosphotransferase
MSKRRRPLAYTLDGSKKVKLDSYDPADTAGMDKDRVLRELEVLGAELAQLTNLLTYARQQSLLVVLQGRDASGKDGSVRKILQVANVLSAQVHAFKVPTDEEREHDFLWRIHRVAPRKGEVALFNRSHYEDVIAARVHELVPVPVWKGRYGQINAFEQVLAAADTIVVKIFLHISRDEQHRRLREREKDPLTAWKLSVADWRELPLWDETTAAYEDAINRCSSPELPFHLVPADKKWFRNLAVFEQLVLALRPYKDSWLRSLKVARRKALREIRLIRGP